MMGLSGSKWTSPGRPGLALGGATTGATVQPTSGTNTMTREYVHLIDQRKVNSGEACVLFELADPPSHLE